MENKNSLITGILVVALVVAAFFVGMLWTKVQNLESGSGGTVNNPGNGAVPQAISIEDAAEQAGLNGKEIAECAKSDEMADKVQKQYQGGIAAGITGTPGNILVDTQENKGRLVSGALPLQLLLEELEVLKGENGTSTYGAAVDMSTLDPLSDEDHVRGEADARYILIEYSDFECPYCQRFHPTAQQLIDENPDIKWAYRHFPLDSIHPNARELAKASECAAKAGGNDAFWEFADVLYQ